MGMRLDGAAALGDAKIVPVVTAETVEQALAAGRAMLAGGLSVVEITLRTEAGLAAIAALRKTLPELTVGAGTVLTPAQMTGAIAAGAHFLVSPGFSEKLLHALRVATVPAIPGFGTVAEAMTLWDAGYRTVKFFPAEAMGGIDTVRAVGSVLPDLRIMPTGGIGPAAVSSYLALPNVLAVGGSWLTPRPALSALDDAAMAALARDAVSLATGNGAAP